MENKSLVSVKDYSKAHILEIIKLAEKFEEKPQQRILEDKVIASLFFEPSTRTRLSFESAVNKLSGRIVGFTDSGSSSVSKGESLKDTIRTVANYTDLIIMRHPLEGSAKYAVEVSDVPVINAGDGANQHPTQTMLDLYSIYKTQGTLENLNLFLVGDLKYGRTVHSLLIAMSKFNTNFYFVSHSKLRIPVEYRMFMEENNINYREYNQFPDDLSNADIIYMTRVQKERFSDQIEYEKTKDNYILEKSMLKHTKDNLKILHPLPRLHEINEDVDDTKQAYYFQQAKNGVYTRQAIIADILGLQPENK
ncbi:MAG: aspartate carbamoyltransferase [Bacteroidota bacterium]|nr:aspartate carbamoyltransferase [Bacteroidota bacterium]